MQAPCPKCGATVELTEIGRTLVGECPACSRTLEVPAGPLEDAGEVGTDDAKKELEGFLAELRSKQGRPADAPMPTDAPEEGAPPVARRSELAEMLTAMEGAVVEPTPGRTRAVVALLVLTLLAGLIGSALVAAAIQSAPLPSPDPAPPPAPEATETPADPAEPLPDQVDPGGASQDAEVPDR